jgi:hypothetical protein
MLRGEVLPLRWLPLEPLRAIVALACWARACASRRVEWRGHPFVLGEDSAITPLRTAPVEEPRRRISA